MPGATVWSAGVAAGALVCVLVVMLGVVDLLVSRRRLDGTEVLLPDVVRAGKGKQFELELEWRAAGRRGGVFRVGLPRGVEFDSGGRVREEVLAPGKDVYRTSWAMTGKKRGRFEVKQVYLETGSLAGLWVIRKTVGAALELRIYPDLKDERKGLSAVFLSRGGVGQHALRQVGKGRDFEQLRDYTPGDDYGDIYWKGMAKRGYPVTKMFQVERTQEVYVVVDHSRLSAQEIERVDGSGTVPQLERFLTAALSLGLVAEMQGDLFGVVTMADQVDGFIRARSGKGHYDTCRDALYNLQASEVSPDFEELVIFLRTRLTRRSLLVILTDLSDELTAEAFAENIRLVTRQHLVMVVGLRPEVARPLFSVPDVEEIGDVYRDLGGQFLWNQMAELGKVLGQHGVQWVMP
ncbi:MAG: DUF58 domain-containing protein, partial [Verrucomicrobiales bacterium]|nr:DUF58 domain-containing protein [Verrucomicrobiales bacterium]